MDRGEQSFVKLPLFGAKLYNRVMGITPIQYQISQIAHELLKEIKLGRILDVGTGHGRLLKELYNQNPKIELHGLDISKAMLTIAKTNLAHIGANLIQSNINSTPYENDFFDLITCTGSFYLWNHPKESLNEIYRILKPRCKALLFETYKNYDVNQFKRALKENLKEEPLLYKILMPRFLKKQLRMTYSIEDVKGIINSTKFSKNFEITKIPIASLPIWMKIELRKSNEL